MRARARLALFALVVLCCSSCKGGKQFYPVRGQVFVDGKPGAGVMVVFHPVNDPDPEPVLPTAVVGADGSFLLKSFVVQDRVLRDGAQAGEYRVTCAWYPQDLQKYLGNEKLPDKLHGKYALPKESGLKAEVLEKETELPPFKLSAKN